MNNAREFTARLADLVRREQASMADFLLALADFHRRRLWLELGYSSLFVFLNRELGLSKGASHYRKVAAELIQRVPQIVEPLRDGRLCITSIVELAKVLTPENHRDVLPRFFHRSKREAMEVTAELRPDPAPPMRDVVTKVCTVPRVAATVESKHVVAELAAPVQLANLPHANSQSGARDMMSLSRAELPLAPSAEPGPPPAPPRPAQRDGAVPLTAELSRYHVTVSRRFLEKLEAARAALSHARPGATAEEILEAGLDLVLSEYAKRKGLVAKPRKEPPPAKSDCIPAHVKRAVWIRDGGRCQWPIEGGGVCGSTLQLEFDHITPRALGGLSTVDNIRIACKVHNGLAARLAFGDEWMDRFTRRRRRDGEAPPPSGAPSASSS